MSVFDTVRERAHLVLGAIRLFNGVAALLVPEKTVRRLGADPDASPTAVYPLRMFGVRTVVLGLELLLGEEETRAQSMRTGVLIHGSDVCAALLGGVRQQLPPRVAVPLVGISTINTSLAILASCSPRRSRRVRRRLGWR